MHGRLYAGVSVKDIIGPRKHDDAAKAPTISVVAGYIASPSKELTLHQQFQVSDFAWDLDSVILCLGLGPLEQHLICIT